MLRASTEANGTEVDLRAVTEGNTAAESGVPEGSLLVRFAEAAVGRDAEALAETRTAIGERLGEPALVDAACIVANFQRMVRIADGTGIPLDTPVAMLSSDLRADLGIDDFGAAAHTPKAGPMQRLGASLLRPALHGFLRIAGRRRRK